MKKSSHFYPIKDSCDIDSKPSGKFRGIFCNVNFAFGMRFQFFDQHNDSIEHHRNIYAKPGRQLQLMRKIWVYVYILRSGSLVIVVHAD